MSGVTYFNRRGFSINEGGGFANITIHWFARGRFDPFIYVYIGGFRLHTNMLKRRRA